MKLSVNGLYGHIRERQEDGQDVFDWEITKGKQLMARGTADSRASAEAAFASAVGKVLTPIAKRAHNRSQLKQKLRQHAANRPHLAAYMMQTLWSAPYFLVSSFESEAEKRELEFYEDAHPMLKKKPSTHHLAKTPEETARTIVRLMLELGYLEHHEGRIDRILLTRSGRVWVRNAGLIEPEDPQMRALLQRALDSAAVKHGLMPAPEAKPRDKAPAKPRR